MLACAELDMERVSIKATTSEKIGFIGREEGIATFDQFYCSIENNLYILPQTLTYCVMVAQQILVLLV